MTARSLADAAASFARSLCRFSLRCRRRWMSVGCRLPLMLMLLRPCSMNDSRFRVATLSRAKLGGRATNVLGPRTLRSLSNIEFDGVSLPQTIEAFAIYSALMEEVVLTPIVLDKAESLIDSDRTDRSSHYGPPTFSFASRAVDADRQHLTPTPGRAADLTFRAHGLLPLPLNDALCAGLPLRRAYAHRSASSAALALLAGPRSLSLPWPPEDSPRGWFRGPRVVRPVPRAPCQPHPADQTTLSDGLAADSPRRQD